MAARLLPHPLPFAARMLNNPVNKLWKKRGTTSRAEGVGLLSTAFLGKGLPPCPVGLEFETNLKIEE